MDQEGIRKLADLARIDVSETELQSLSESIGKVLAYVGSVQEVAGAAEAPEIGAVANVLRGDVVTNEPGAYHDAILANAPHTEDGYVKVPKIF